MKLVEQDAFPRIFHVFTVKRAAEQCVGHDLPLFRLAQPVFRQAVRHFDRVVRAVAAAGMVLQIALINRQRVICRRTDGVEEAVRIGERKRMTCFRLVGQNLLDVRNRRTAAMVADAVKHHEIDRLSVGDVVAADEVAVIPHVAAVAADENTESRHLVIAAAPAEGRTLEGILFFFAFGRAHKDIIFDAAFAQQLRQRAVVAERVDVIAGFDGDAEFFADIFL